MTPEFSREIEVETVSEAMRSFEIGADETERRRLAGRFRLETIDRLKAAVTLQRRAGIIHAEGEIDAAVVQACVVTGEPIPAKLRAPFHVRYVADPFAKSGDEEVELMAEDCDTLPIEDGKIDIGELAAETLVLALDPYPRSTQADAAMQEREGERPDEISAFAALQGLKDKLGG